MSNFLLPRLSEADPKLSAEGSIDPLGMYAIADSLAIKLIPGVRERQTHPRFLTAIAVSHLISDSFDEDVVAKDGVSEPWQVFEWYFVEGLVRTTRDSKLLRGLPGQDKAARAIKDRVHLSEKRYLKTPTVFGFHGVYRGLARDTGIERAGRLGDLGYQLIAEWEKEQDLPGFTGTTVGRGKDVREQITNAVQEGLNKGSVARSGSWTGWKFFSDHLGIYDAGQREAEVIATALLDPASGFRREVLTSLTSSAGQQLWKEEVDSRLLSERRFHKLLSSTASTDLTELLQAIDAYEYFCRLLQDAFDDCLLQMSQTQHRIPPHELGALAGVTKAAAEIPEIFSDVSDKLSPFGQVSRFQEKFSSLAERMQRGDWIERLLEHHRRVQSSKPPGGKAPWFDRFDDGSCMIRTGYLREKGGQHDDSYVHAYRTQSLWSFANDSGLVA